MLALKHLKSILNSLLFVNVLAYVIKIRHASYLLIISYKFCNLSKCFTCLLMYLNITKSVAV